MSTVKELRSQAEAAAWETAEVARQGDHLLDKAKCISRHIEHRVQKLMGKGSPLSRPGGSAGPSSGPGSACARPQAECLVDRSSPWW
jgi:hypothetical protein